VEKRITYYDEFDAKFVAVVPSTNGMESTKTLIALGYRTPASATAIASLNLMSAPNGHSEWIVHITCV